MFSDHFCLYTMIETDATFAEAVPEEFTIRSGNNLDWAAYKERVMRYKVDWDARYGNRLKKAMRLYERKLFDEKETADGIVSVEFQDELRDEIINTFEITDEFVTKAFGMFVADVLVGAARDEFGMRRKGGDVLPWMTKDIKKTISRYESY